MNITSQKYGTAAGLALLAVASAWGGTVYRPGATQGWYEKPTEKKNTTDFTVDIRSLDAARIDRTLGFNMADFRAENASSAGWLNPLSGITWKWHQNYMTYAYDGYIRLDEGAVYMMHTRADDGAAVEIDGAFAINQGTGSGYDNCTAATYTHDRSTGWYPVRAFAWDWDGGKGPAAVNTYGLAWNTNGVAGPASGKNSISTTSTDWSGFYDTGDMTFLKTRTDESFTAISGLGTSGDDLVIGLSVGALPQDAELYVLFGSANAGIATPEWWDSMVLLGTLGGGTAYSTNFTVSAVATGLDLATEPVVCLYLKGVNPADTATMFEEWLTPFTAVAEAEATIAVAEVNYTDATFAVTVSSMGVGAAAIASVSVDIATDEEFQNIVQRIVDATGTNAVPTIFVLATQDALLTNTTYHARAVIVNDQAATSYSEQTDFTTLEPTAPVFSAIGLVAASFDGGTFSFMLADYGDDSTNAVVTFEISETPDFSTVMSFDVANVLGTLPHTARGTATGLDAGTTYHARFRAVNTWLLDSVSESPMFETRATPFRTSAIGAVAESGGTEVSISVTDIFAGATVSAELFIGATEATATRQASWQSVAEGAPLAFTYTGALSTFVAKYVITAAYGGGTYPVTVTASVSVGNTVYAPATLADTVGYRLRAGDTLVLPEPATTLDYYLPLNLRVAELQADGRTVKAVGPGASGIEYYSYASGSSVLDGTGGIIVVPDPVGSGRVFIFNENASSWNWSNAANWECVTDPGHAGYPNAVDDVAMVIYYTQGGKALTVGTTAEPVVTVGELYVGQITSVATSLRFQGASSEERTLNFQRSTRDPALVQVTGGAKDSLFFDLNMGGSGASSALDVRLNGAGLDIDLGYTLALLDNSFKSNNLTRVNTQYSNIHVPAGSTYRLANGPSRTRFWGDSQQGQRLHYAQQQHRVPRRRHRLAGHRVHLHRSVRLLQLQRPHPQHRQFGRARQPDDDLARRGLRAATVHILHAHKQARGQRDTDRRLRHLLHGQR